MNNEEDDLINITEWGLSYPVKKPEELNPNFVTVEDLEKHINFLGSIAVSCVTDAAIIIESLIGTHEVEGFVRHFMENLFVQLRKRYGQSES